jgi:hypothetical protein
MKKRTGIARLTEQQDELSSSKGNELFVAQ